MSERRLRWISLVVLGVVLTLALRYASSSKETAPPLPRQDETILTIPVEIVEAGREPRRLEVKVPAAVEIPAPLR